MLNGKRRCRNPFTEDPNGWLPIPSLVTLRFFENARRFSVSLCSTLYPHELFLRLCAVLKHILQLALTTPQNLFLVQLGELPILYHHFTVDNDLRHILH